MNFTLQQELDLAVQLLDSGEFDKAYTVSLWLYEEYKDNNLVSII